MKDEMGCDADEGGLVECCDHGFYDCKCRFSTSCYFGREDVGPEEVVFSCNRLLWDYYFSGFLLSLVGRTS